MVLVARWLMLVINDDGYGIWLGMLGMMCRRRRRRHGEILTITIIIFYCDVLLDLAGRKFK